MKKYLTAEDTRKLGIEVGDFVSFDPRFEETETWFYQISPFR